MYKYIILLVACLNAFVYAHTYAARDQHFIDDSIQGDLKKVQHYLAAGANHDALNDALLAATEHRQLRVVERLVKARPSLQSINDALQIAVAKDHVHIVKLLIDAHANVDCAVVSAAKNGHERIFRTLLAKHPDRALIGDSLVESAKNGHVHVVVRILATNPDSYYIRLAYMSVKNLLPDICELLEPYLEDEQLEPCTMIGPMPHLELAPPAEPFSVFLNKILEDFGAYTDKNGIMWTVDNYEQLGGFVMGCYGVDAAPNAISSALIRPVKICSDQEPIQVYYKIVKSKIEVLQLKLSYLANRKQHILEDRALCAQQDREYAAAADQNREATAEEQEATVRENIRNGIAGPVAADNSRNADVSRNATNALPAPAPSALSAYVSTTLNSSGEGGSVYVAPSKEELRAARLKALDKSPTK